MAFCPAIEYILIIIKKKKKKITIKILVKGWKYNFKD